MKHPDRMLLHSLDAVTPGGLAATSQRARRVVVYAVLFVSTHTIAFVFGYLLGSA